MTRLHIDIKHMDTASISSLNIHFWANMTLRETIVLTYINASER